MNMIYNLLQAILFPFQHVFLTFRKLSIPDLMQKKLLLPIFFLGLLVSCAQESKECPEEIADTKEIDAGFTPEEIQFPSLDELPITANLYEIDKVSPIIVLCHQAGYNKFEYEGIAQKLMEQGFNCIAIDQRSGGPLANKVNQTTIEAQKKDLPTDYLAAEQDIKAAVAYAAKRYNGKVILWGSSYSSTLVLYVGAESEDVQAIISFSPGDYFVEEKGSLVEKLADFEKPLFATSSRYESGDLMKFMEQVGLNENQIQFIPDGLGHHGSRALWTSQAGGKEYWIAITDFLKQFKK
jgi:hypothetical protein